MKKLIILSICLIFSSCALQAIDLKAITIPASNQPTTIVIKATSISTDYGFFRTTRAIADVQQK